MSEWKENTVAVRISLKPSILNQLQQLVDVRNKIVEMGVAPPLNLDDPTPYIAFTRKDAYDYDGKMKRQCKRDWLQQHPDGKALWEEALPIYAQNNGNNGIEANHFVDQAFDDWVQKTLKTIKAGVHHNHGSLRKVRPPSYRLGDVLEFIVVKYGAEIRREIEKQIEEQQNRG